MSPYRGGANQNRDKDHEADGPGPAVYGCPDRLSDLLNQLLLRQSHLQPFLSPEVTQPPDRFLR